MMSVIEGRDARSPLPRVLLADDHQLVLDRCKTLLQGRFEVVGFARDGIEMVSMAAGLTPDVIVSDISMPKLGGIEALRQLHKMGKSPNVVFLTIHTEDEFVHACLAEGAMGYVAKSYMKSDLIPAIEAALTGRRHISPLVPVRH